jgi:hypothetical protein
LGFLEGTQGESARGRRTQRRVAKRSAQTEKHKRASDRGAVGRKLGVSRGNARRVGQRGAEHGGESPR